MPLLEQVLGQYPKGVKFVFKNFPIRSHKFSDSAARGAMAADRQGKFWPFYNKLFENYNKLSEEKIQEIASGLGLDLTRYEADRKDPALQAKIARDTQDGVKAGVRGTPTIFVNGRLLKNRSLQGFRDLIDHQLERSTTASK